MTAASEARHSIGKVFGLLAGAFALFIIVIAMLAQLGLPDRLTTVLVVMTTVITYAVIGVVARTLSLGDYYVAGRSVPPAFNGLATAAAFISAAGFIGIAAAFFAGEATGLAVAVGWTGGFVLLAIAVAPYYRKSGAVTVPDFLAVRFGNPAVRLVGVAILLACLLPLLAGAVSVAVSVAAAALAISREAALAGTAAVLVLSTLLGGMRAVTLVAGAQAIVMLFGMIIPPLMFSLREYGMPIPQFTFGNALGEGSLIADVPVGTLPGDLLPVAALDGFNLLALALCLAAGVASLPHVVARSGTTKGVADARLSAAWALVFVATVAATAPAVAAFARLTILRDVVGVEAEALPLWFFDHAAAGLIRLCGMEVATIADISAACGATAVVNGPAAGDIALASDTILLDFAEVAALPFVLTALIAAAVLAAALGTAGAAAIAVGNSIGHDVYGALAHRRAAPGRRLIVSRLALLAGIAVGLWLAAAHRDAVLKVAFAAPSLAAAGFFPAIVLGIWWRRATFWGALAGMIAGFGLTGGYVLALQAGAMAPIALFGLTEDGLSAPAAAILGVPVGFIVIAVVSLLTPAPSDARREVVNAIRRPSPDPVLEDHAA